MIKRRPSSKKAHFMALAAIVAITSTVFGCRGEKQAEAAPVPLAAPASATAASAPQAAPAARTKEQAMNALMALPELKAWSSQLEKASGGTVRGALIEYDPKPKTIDGVNYWQFSFVENGGEAVHRWESFLVAERGDEILVEDFATDKTLTLAQWRKEKRPMERTGAN
ncbi:MAG TPA: hypothetical protein VFG03_14750 [Telluria sp.]|nr:hypothetical protein [Telluria sp.]